MNALVLALALGQLPEAQRVVVAPAETLTVESWGQPVTGTVVLIADFLGSAYTFRHVAPLVAERGYRVVVIEPRTGPRVVGAKSQHERQRRVDGLVVSGCHRDGRR